MHGAKYPIVLEVIKNDTYVDDIFPNVGSIKEAKRLIRDINTVLAEGNFRI